MAPSCQSVLVLLGLVASIRAVPAAVPEADVAPRQIELNPPSYSISWDLQPPAPTEVPDEPEDPECPAPEDPEDPEDPIPPPPKPTDQISLSPPSFTVSWDPPLRTTTKKPGWPGWPPKPTKKTSSKPSVTATVTWNKRQFDYDPEPTDLPELPEDPENSLPEQPEDPADGPMPPLPFPTQKDSIDIQPPKATITWGKREEAQAPPPTFWLGKPTATVKWPRPPKTTGHISWGKRQDEEEPTEVAPPIPAPSDEITFLPPTASITWGKRDAAPEPTAAPELVDTEARAAQFTCASSITVSSVKPCPRVGCSPPCHYTPETFELVPGGPGTTDFRCPIVKTATNKCPHCACPTTFLSILPTKRPTTITKSVPLPTSLPTSCPTVTETIVPPCVPPNCPHGAVASVAGNVMKRGAVVEKRVVQVQTTVLAPTVLPPTPSTSNADGCTDAVTKTVNAGCPTYTCVPWQGCSG